MNVRSVSRFRSPISSPGELSFLVGAPILSVSVSQMYLELWLEFSTYLLYSLQYSYQSPRRYMYCAVYMSLLCCTDRTLRHRGKASETDDGKFLVSSLTTLQLLHPAVALAVRPLLP